MTRRKPTQIVHIIPRDGLGGVETAARTMVARDDLPCDFRLLFIAGATLTVDNPRVESSGHESTANPLAYLATLRRCLALRPDVVVFSLWRSVPLLIALRLLRPRLKLVMTLNLSHSIHIVDAAMFRIGSLIADEVWSDSEASFRARKVNRPHRVISFVTSRLQTLAPAQPAALGFVAWVRLVRQKRFDLALEFIQRLAMRGLDPRFDHYGPDGGERALLERSAARLGVADRVSFHGPIAHADIVNAATDSSFFLLPSENEGMAMACVEAMQLGLIPVVTPVGEMANYVINGETGLLIDPARLDEAADAIVALIGDPPKFAAMRRRAINRWADAPLYADDVCAAASALADAPRRAMKGRR